MTPQEVIEYYGSDKAAAGALGYHTCSIQAWVRKGRIPYRAQVLIELVTKGDLKTEKIGRRPVEAAV